MIDKNSWGEYLWHTIHFVSLGYPNNPSSNDKKYYKDFYVNLKNVLPCQECSEHYAENLKKYNIDKFLDTREKLFEWTILIHNEVNRMLGKSEWSVKEAYNYYTNPFFNLKNSTKCFSNSYFLIVLLLIFILLIILYKNNLFKLKFKK
jgi:hypothetical protein|tara:strand:- start:84 stop:527 length:444 start_codon:yes stop_codon:yes gene_type:complete